MKNKKETFYTFLFKDDNAESLWVRNYVQLLEVSVNSLQFFSTRKIIIFTNIEIPFNYPNMEVIRFEMEKDLPLPNRIVQPNDHSNDTAASFAYYKMEKSLQLLKEGYEKVVWIDSDAIATKYIDNIWDKDIEDLNYPLTKRHTYQYLIQHQDGKSYSDAPWMDCEDLSGDLMEYLGVKEITLWSSFFSFFLSHKNCISFWEEALDSFQKALRDNVSMPYVLETFVNVMLWKYKASVSISEDLSCIDLDPNLDYPFDLDDLFNNDSKSIKKIEHGNAYFSEWLCVPQNKENILFIHGIKKPKTAEWVFEKYINDIVMLGGNKKIL